MKHYKQALSVLLLLCLSLNTLAGCSTSDAPPSNPAQTIEGTEPDSTELDTEMSDVFKEAVIAGIAWEELAANPTAPVTAADTIKLMENALAVLGKDTAPAYLTAFSADHNGDAEIQRYQLAQLLQGVFYNVKAEHDFQISATSVFYDVGGAYREAHIWDCPDIQEIDALSNGCAEACDYAITAYDRLTGDKLMDLYEDWTFRPAETVSVESAVGTFLHFARSFETDPVYTDVTDDIAARHTIDPALYSGETTLPEATNADLPNWRGFNISLESMLLPGALSGNPDDNFYEAEIGYIKELGGNYAHIYLSWSWFQGPAYTCDNKVNLTRLELLDKIIACCMKNDIHLQLVFNDVPNISGRWEDTTSLEVWWAESQKVFTDESVRDTVTAFWRMLARRYADIPNNYLSFNLMNECNPLNDENYAWAFQDAVAAIWEESPGRVIVADVHSSNITGASMAELGCALSFHLYLPRDIAVVTRAVEEGFPGFYETLEWPACIIAGILYGREAAGDFPELAAKPMTISGNLDDAVLRMDLNDISWGFEVIRITADGAALYEATPTHEYHEDVDVYKPTEAISVTIPAGTKKLEIACSEGYAFSMDSLTLTYPDGVVISLIPYCDNWHGMPYTDVQINGDRKVLDGEYDFANAKQGLISLNELIGIGQTYGVDVMIGECGIFEGDLALDFGMPQETAQAFTRDEIELFESLGLAWACELYGRYTVLTPAPYLTGIEYKKIDRMPYYANLSMEQFLKEMLKS